MVSEVGVGTCTCTPSSDEPEHKKTPEMNELEYYLNSLKIWAHNFEKQKSCIIFTPYLFCQKKYGFEERNDFDL